MSKASDSSKGYDSTFQDFDTPLMRKVRAEAYGDDIGQHSWTSAEELRRLISSIEMSKDTSLLDLGCGPGGPLTFIARECGCHAFGVDISEPALEVARRRAQELHISTRVTLIKVNADSPLPCVDRQFDAVISIDVVLHLRDRDKVFNEIARVLKEGGKFAFTDAAVVSGPLSDDEKLRRSPHGNTQFVNDGFNEELLRSAGFSLLKKENTTGAVIAAASGRISARIKYRDEMIRIEGEEYFTQQMAYLETVLELSRRAALTRFTYLARRI